MAVVRDFICSKCETRKSEVTQATFPLVCNACLKAEENKARREWFLGRQGLTLEERIQDIERWMYEHRNLNHSSGPQLFG